MKTSTVVWTIAVLVVIAGIAWYVYANTGASVATPVGDTTTQSDTPLPTGDMTPTPITPIASSTVSASTSAAVH